MAVLKLIDQPCHSLPEMVEWCRHAVNLLRAVMLESHREAAMHGHLLCIGCAFKVAYLGNATLAELIRPETNAARFIGFAPPEQSLAHIGDAERWASGEALSPRLRVDADRLIAVLDGIEHPLRGKQVARWLKVLFDRPGEWIPAPDLAKHDSELDGARTDRLRKQLPPQLQALIETSKRHGARLKLV